MASASTSTHVGIYDVFLNFRGADTRYHFTDHLYSELRKNDVRTFRDDEELERGDVIAPGLLKAIEQSRISIVVFSENYAQSRWCLDELVKIIECRTEREQIVLPVFYHVDPSHVRKQMGSYGEAFADHEKDADLKKREKIQKWRTALTETSNLSGWRLLDNQYESDVIDDITNNIITRLNPKSLHVGENIVGMSIRLKKLRSLINIDLNNVLVVGICGIGGIGKTTIAKALYNVISYKFEGVSFLANVRENSKDDVGLLRLQQQLLDDIRKRKNQQISNVHEGMDAIKKVLSLKRVLVVLDDVDNCKQVENLVGKRDCFVRGSRILITTRDRHPLDAYGADKPYHEIEELNSEEALQLFSLYAFKPNCHQEDYEDLSNHIVKYAKGLPLVLRVLGSHLCERTPNQWKSELHKLEREPVQDIQNVLKISYNGLDRTQGEIFLDIACFFKGQDKDFVSRILDGCDLYAESGFSVLCDRSLITILDNKIHMHDLIQQMGWHIVREQYPKEPGKWSRLWEPKDVFHVLTRNTGTKAIEGIFLDMSTSKQLQFTTKAFKRMKMLRLLKVHRDAKYDSIVNSLTPVEPSKVLLSQEHFCRDFEFPSQELRYLHWDGYPMESLPSNFYAENLVELNLRCSNIKQLWETELLEKLKVIDLSHCQHLNKIPNPSSVPNLEILTLKGCINLETLPENMVLAAVRSLKSCLRI
ncbi:disease resistance protein RPV1 isoform X3 [Vitis vinifera]|uniref:disease resistance protein RPV1 isoform X3 n=1 Tax=Vitis vinifera TaxID=29760 RepID=UPI00053F596B|nr:disease resistance protein RPV1 isoform X3 [Vitis vinifera]|eukprot:XP_010665198.1 PREDICTED: TMV resistance protein N-like isoform X2 [Vitis vinifera]